MLKENVKAKVIVIDFNDRKGWKLYHKENIFAMKK